MGGQKWPKMRQKTLNNVKMWKIFCTKVVVVFVVFVVVVVAVVIVVVVVPDSGFDRKKNDEIQPFHFCLRQQIILGNNDNEIL